ncbi:unnamed protein product [Prunus brigantina]
MVSLEVYMGAYVEREGKRGNGQTYSKIRPKLAVAPSWLRAATWCNDDSSWSLGDIASTVARLGYVEDITSWWPESVVNWVVMMVLLLVNLCTTMVVQLSDKLEETDSKAHIEYDSCSQ